MTETNQADSDELSERLEYLTLYISQLEEWTLTPAQTLWLLASRYLLSVAAIVGGPIVAFTWATDGRAAAFALGETYIHLTIAALMIVGAMITIITSISQIIDRRSARTDRIEDHPEQDIDE